jgi:hypothetical protein
LLKAEVMNFNCNYLSCQNSVNLMTGAEFLCIVPGKGRVFLLAVTSGPSFEHPVGAGGIFPWNNAAGARN